MGCDDLSYKKLCEVGSVDRPHYGYCSYFASGLASELNIGEVSLIEFGVANGNGLLNLENHAKELESRYDPDIEIYGFDTGSGLPEPEDYRDLPYTWQEGDYDMNEERLRSHLEKSELILGDVKETVSRFVEEKNPAPIGAIFLDLDYYSSTIDSLRSLLKIPDSNILPRVMMYFDDVALGASTQYIPQIGAQKAIRDYNSEVDEEQEHIGKIQFNTQDRTNPNLRTERLYSYHRFDHDEYGSHVGPKGKQLSFNA